MNINNLDELLEQPEGGNNAEIIKQVRNPISQVYITKGALNKAYTYAELVCDVLGESLECYGFLITPKESKDRIARDVYLAPNQTVSGADVIIEGEDVILAGREIDALGYKVLGWWHSHANFDTFHSGTDDKNMITVLNQLAPTNYITVRKKTHLLGDELKVRRRKNNLVISGKDSKKRIIIEMPEGILRPEGTIDSKILSEIQNLQLSTPARIGFAYSVVVNAIRGKPYCELATKEFCHTCYEGEEKSKEANLRVVEGDIVLNEKDMREEIEKKVSKSLPFFKFGKKGKKSKKSFFSNLSWNGDSDQVLFID